MSAAPSRRDLIVVGASAGGVEALKNVVSRFPADLRAPVCVVLHLAPGSPSALAGILSRSGALPCRAARDGDTLEPGTIYVAQPDRHLEIDGGRLRLTVGPRENNVRPAIDVLFRSAAHTHGAGVIGVVLSGTRDDGTAGLAAIKAGGGRAVVQDPRDALYSGMPASAIAHVHVDAIVAAADIPNTVVDMVENAAPAGDPPLGLEPTGDIDPHIAICPECGGVLRRDESGVTPQWACRVGHRYSPESLADAQAANVEAALWTAVRALEDRALLLGNLATQMDTGGSRRSATRFRSRSEAAREQAELVRRALAGAARTSLRAIAPDDAAETGSEGAA